MHGGADGSGAPKGERNGNYKHGRYTAEVAATRRWLREATQMFRDLKKMTTETTAQHEEEVSRWRKTLSSQSQQKLGQQR